VWRIVVLLALSCSSPAKPPAEPVERPPADDAPQGSCEPGRCMDDISRAIQERRDQTRACYDKGVKGKPGIEGRLIINFKIDADGTVEDASQGMQENQITEAAVVDCVVAVIKHLKFGKSPTGKTTRAYHLFEFSHR